MHSRRIYLISWTLQVLINIGGYCHDKHECLTWEINSNLLTLICRLNHSSEPVILIDNHEREYVRCSFTSSTCFPRHKNKDISIDNYTNTVTFTIEDIDKKNGDGKWKCKQGKNMFETEVSTSKGLMHANNLHISGEILHPKPGSQVVQLKCYSCKEPHKNNIEFLINGKSVDSILYHKNTGECFHRHGNCKPQDCSCHPSGNEFIRLFPVTNVNVTYFSCYTIFFDKDKKSLFSTSVTIRFNGKVFLDTVSDTKVIKPPAQNYDEDERNKTAPLNTATINMIRYGKDSKRTEILWIWIIVGVSMIVVLLLPVILFILCTRSMINRKKDPSKSKTYENQKSSLLSKDKDISTNSGTEDKCIHEEALTNENAKQDTETIMFMYSQGNQDPTDKMTDVLHHDKCMHEETFTNGNRKQDIEMKTIKVLNSPGYTDAIDNMADGLYIKIEEPNIAVETETQSFLQNRQKMPKKSENNFNEQKEESIESTQHVIGMEFTNTKGTEREGNLKIWCQPCQKTNNNVPACHWCLNCEEAFCECCKEIHSQKNKLEKITPLHNEINISNWCSHHHDHQYQYFCEDHYRLCCYKCMTIDHGNCLIITSIADASKGFKTSEVVDKYKRVLKTISKSFDDLKNIIEQGKNDVNQNTCDVLSDLEMNCHLVIEVDQLQRFKELFPKHVQDAKNICLSKLQKQLSVVYKCKFFINTIETSLENIIQQCHEEQVFRTVLISTKFLASTLKKVISDSESIKLVFNPMSVGDKHVMFGIREKERVITQNLTALLARKRRDEYGTQHIITDFRNTPI